LSQRKKREGFSELTKRKKNFYPEMNVGTSYMQDGCGLSGGEGNESSQRES
jgi:hypothetical protein